MGPQPTVPAPSCSSLWLGHQAVYHLPPAALQSLLPAAATHYVTTTAVLQNTPELQPGDLTLAHVTLSRYQVLSSGLSIFCAKSVLIVFS